MRYLLSTAAVALLASCLISESQAGFPILPRRKPNLQYEMAMQGRTMPWHNAYYNPAYGEPYALVVPPTAEYQSFYSWGVGGTRVTPIYHQYGRAYPGVGGGTGAYGGFYPTPNWPSDTNQMGYYMIRGPW